MQSYCWCQMCGQEGPTASCLSWLKLALPGPSVLLSLGSSASSVVISPPLICVTLGTGMHALEASVFLNSKRGLTTEVATGEVGGRSFFVMNIHLAI